MSHVYKPCDKCTQGVCDYRRCDAYKQWFVAAWKQFQRYIPHDYWGIHLRNSEKFAYEHPDLIRRYLQEGPCGLCVCADVCDIPCGSYLCWWDARRAWLRWQACSSEEGSLPEACKIM